jgi:hypothetical protein
MTDQHRDPGPDTNGTGKSEHIVHTSHVRETGGTPTTGFIVGGLVVAVAIIAFFVFGDTDSRKSAEINMPPTVENTINQAPDAAPEPNATPSTDGSAAPDASGGSTATTPPNPDSGSTN